MKNLSPLASLTALLLTLALPHAGRAQEVTPLTLEQALARTAEHPRLRAQSHAERAADALIEQAGLRPNPTLDFTVENFAGTGALRGVDGLEGTAEYSQTIERGDKRGRRTALATREQAITQAESAVLRHELRAATAAAGINVVAAQARLALAAGPRQLARETLAAVEARVRAGAASPAEAARARATLAATQADYTRAEAALAIARAALVASWGGDPAEAAPLAGRLQVPETLPEPAGFLAGLARHPRLDLQQAVIAGRRAALDLEQSQAKQDITVAGGVRFFRDSSDAAFIAGVSVPLPVRNQNQGGIRAARETLHGAEQTTRAIEQELRADFSATWQELIAAHTATRHLQQDALPATEEAYAIVRRAYEEGQLPLLDVLEAQRALAGLQREILDHTAAYAAALARVEALTNPSFSATARLLSDR